MAQLTDWHHAVSSGTWDFIGGESQHMPNRRRPINYRHPLGAFALRLRRLQAEAIARAGSRDEVRRISPTEIARNSPWESSRTAVYAALNGTRLASTETISTMVAAWDIRGKLAIGEWLMARNKVEDELIALRYKEDVDAYPGTGATSDTRVIGETEEAAEFAKALSAVRQRPRSVILSGEAGLPWLVTDISRVADVDADALVEYLSGQFVPRPSELLRVLDALSVGPADRSRLLELHRSAWKASSKWMSRSN
ncbi:hypothetical protein [Streptomyces sp. NPDC090053]|uniref:hypothetical protein n=1 Tax=Streptomyces sp. NPDC090053 TaxID=3365932 RepID=UPI0037FFAEF9